MTIFKYWKLVSNITKNTVINYNLDYNNIK